MTSNRRLSLIIVALLLVIALGQTAIAAAWPQLDPEDAKNIMPVSQLKRGMRGYGLTVFHGTKIEKFDVEILGVLKQMNLGKDLILVRAGGGPITSRNTGIIAGMSGSPVYINGKLVGAVAYGSSFSREPVGMLTPIADMLEAWDTNLPKHASGYSSIQSLSQPVSLDGQSVNKVSIEPYGSSRTGIENGVLYMRPLMTPLMVSGLSPRGIARLSEILQPFGIQPMAGPGGGAAKSVSAPDALFAPGAAIGMSLASGDIDLTGVGTLTYKRGNRIVAFGHPMLSIGAVDAPMSLAFVDDVISSYQVSTKLASPIKTLGRIFQDRPWCIAGRIGESAQMIPVTVDVDDQSSKRNRTYKVNVINHPLLASRLITMIVGEAIYQMHPAPGDSTAEVSYEVVADQVGKITRSNVFFDSISVDMAALSDIGNLLQMLSSNKFHPLDIKSVNMKVRILDKRNTATIDRIFVKQGEYEPGDTVDIGVVLRPYKGEKITKTFSIRIPATATDGKVNLIVRGGASPAGMPGMMMVGGSFDSDDDGAPVGSSGIASADNVKQLVEKYLEREKNNEIVVQLQMRSTAINVAGEKLTGLPTAIADIMKSSRNSGLRMERDEVKEVFDQDMIVTGSARLSIDVKKKNLNERKSGEKPGEPSMSSSESYESSSSTDSDDEGMIVSYMAGMGSGIDWRRLDDSDDSDSVEITEETVIDESDSDDSTSVEVTAGEDIKKSSDNGDSSSSKSTDSKGQTDVKTVVRQATTWMQKTQADFSKGLFSGVSASSKDKLELAPTLKKLVETPEQFVWCVAPAKDGVYAGTGDAGKIYHISNDGKMSLFYETGELEVHAIVTDAAGNLYAGTSPKGNVYKIGPDGKGELLYKTGDRYVLALALDGEGNLYVGVGDAGKIYRVTPDGSGSLFAQVNEQQILSLHWAKDRLVVGTGINGIVYSIDKHGSARPIFDAAESSITAVVADGKDNVYAGTSPKGVVYRISPDGRAKSVFTKATRVLSMVADKNDNIYAVSDGSVARISPDETAIMLDSSREKAQFLSVAFNDETQTLYAGTGNIGSVYISQCCNLTGTFESAVHDTKMISRWGRVKWNAEVPEGGTVEVRTRTGNVDTPDSSWTDWSPAYTSGSGEQIISNPGRYIQYQVTLKAGKDGESPRVSTVALSYLTPNQAPTVKLTAPVGGEVWSGNETIKWTGSDPDKDTLTYDLFYSADGGKSWTSLVGGVSGASANKLSEEQIVDKVKSELEKSTDIPADMKEKVLAEPEKGKPMGATASTPSAAAKSVTNTSHTWDTRKVADGTYLIKVVASDKTSNAIDPMTHEVISEPVVICNTAPKLTLYSSGSKLKTTGAATITGSAASALVEVIGVQYRIAGGAWTAAAPGDGMFDSSYENFTITTGELSKGTHKVEVQAVDAAGNASSSTIEVEVS